MTTLLSPTDTPRVPPPPKFAMSVSIDDATGRIHAVYFRIRDGSVAETQEAVEGKVFADYDDAGRLLGVEMIAPCSVSLLDQLAEREPEPVRQFLTRSVPRSMCA